MQVGVGAVRGAVVVAVALATLLGGCARSEDGDGKNASSASPNAGSGGAGGTAAASGGSIGSAGSACALPVRFDLAKRWKAKAIDAEAELSKASRGPTAT
ncbi:lipoprotein [Streptomyces sp. NPDC001817]|uniref:lipoprotein n=1 Tax=Streptomyces sp. NPDC001817 TaxID=3154398 RepID=UPI003328AD97